MKARILLAVGIGLATAAGAFGDSAGAMLRAKATAKTWGPCVADVANQILRKTTYKNLRVEGTLRWSNLTGWVSFEAFDKTSGRRYTGGLYALWDAPACTVYESPIDSRYVFFNLRDEDGAVVLKAVRDTDRSARLDEVPAP